MTTEAWENIARCAALRYAQALNTAGQKHRAMAEWETWQAALERSGRCPF